jgi:hypothetical protein
MCGKTYLPDYDISRGFLSKHKDFVVHICSVCAIDQILFCELQSTVWMSFMGLIKFSY